jgi:hypothetical protein
MGLDAVVYKDRSKLPVDPEDAGLRLEESTGEWYCETGNVPEPIRAAGVEAMHKRLGNVSLIAALGEEVRSLLPGSSVLLSKVLYEGGHAGDVVATEEVAALKREIALLKGRPSTLSADLAALLNELEELAAAADENHNPIAFV